MKRVVVSTVGAVTAGGLALWVILASEEPVIAMALVAGLVVGVLALIAVMAPVAAAAAIVVERDWKGVGVSFACGLTASLLCAVAYAFAEYTAVAAFALLGATIGHTCATRTERRWRKARAVAAARIAERKRLVEERRANAVKEATRRIATEWLTDAMGTPESKGRLALLADLDADTAWALARLHRKGVPAEYVAERWTNGEPLDADALVASYREGGAA